MLDHSKIIEACRLSGAAFGKLIYPPYQTPKHILKIWKVLEAIERGEITRAIITAPPRHGKTKTVSEIFPAWFMGRNPASEVILASYAQGIATRFGRNIRNFMSDQNYKKIFPHSILSKDSKGKSEFATISGGEFHAAGLDGQLTSKGARLLILDDTIKNLKQARSQNYRQELKDFYEAVADTRLTPDGRIIAMHTRWHQDDLIGWLLSEKSNENWTHIDMPAIDELGQALWPEQFSIERLRHLQQSNPKVFETLYQQRPSVEGGEIVKSEWWQFYQSKDKPKHFQKIIQSWDLTFDRNKNDDSKNDYAVGTVWGITTINGKLRAYLLDMIRRKANFNEQIKMVVELLNREPRAGKKYVEKAANGAAMITFLENKIPKIEAVKPAGGKQERLEAVSTYIENGQVFLPHPKEEPWVQCFIDEHSIFPNGKHDDQVDSTSQALYQIFGEYKAPIDYKKIYG